MRHVHCYLKEFTCLQCPSCSSCLWEGRSNTCWIGSWSTGDFASCQQIDTPASFGSLYSMFLFFFFGSCYLLVIDMPTSSGQCILVLYNTSCRRDQFGTTTQENGHINEWTIVYKLHKRFYWHCWLHISYRWISFLVLIVLPRWKFFKWKC